ncbi:hypothetical protein Sango_0818800 [Sesamum angolense]|uniref:Uncharacterized protein n=1 Tax=Sesamum angolense TaxID=2727404 RepID=A0AAE1X4A3_9LAMI|nr:hypothetical protein Sango_0818800 [Sesamum angolense]
MSFMDPQTNVSELEVKSVANRLPNASIDTKKVIKSHILTENVPACLEVLEATPTQLKAPEHNYTKSVDKITEAVLPEDSKRSEQDLEDSYEISINYAHNSLGWYGKEIEINDIFVYSIAIEIMDEDENDPQTIEEC